MEPGEVGLRIQTETIIVMVNKGGLLMPKSKNPLKPWASLVIGLLCILLLVGFIVSITSCSFPFLQVINPTFTVQVQTLDDIISVKIPVELPDFVTEGQCCNFEISEKFYGIKYRGLIKDTDGRLIDYYILVIKRGKPSKPIALRAVQMPNDKFWIYIKEEPVPATQDQVKEKIEGLIGRKI